jgi:hypothetical protein
MLGHRGLRDPELPLYDAPDVTGRALPINQQLQDPPPDGVTEDVERVHTPAFNHPLLI